MTTGRQPSGWDSDLGPAICEKCDWRYALSPEQLALLCPHCFQASLTPLSGEEEEPAPELLLPFSLPAEALSRSMQNFAQAIWLAPYDLTAHNLHNRLQRVYLPVWLVDGQVQATWQAEMGFDYQAISHRDNYDQNRGGWASERITETRIRWQPRLGRLQRRYDNIPAPALEEYADLQRRLGPYDPNFAEEYQAQAMTGALIRLPNRSPDDAWPEAVPGFQAKAREECRQACRADHIREFRWQASYVERHWTLLLLPLYTTYYLDDDQTAQPLLIHGQSGQLSGRPRASLKRAKRVAFAIAAVAVVLFGLSLIAALLASALQPAWLSWSGLGLFLAILIGLAALIPPGLVWQFNRSH